MARTTAFFLAALLLTGAAACSTAPPPVPATQRGPETALSALPFQARGNEPACWAPSTGSTSEQTVR